MSTTARTDEIDALVSSVRDFVAHKEPRKSQGGDSSAEKLVLTDEQRVVGSDVSPRVGSSQTVLDTLATLEAAVTTQPNDWDDDYTVDEFAAASDAIGAFHGDTAEAGIAARIESVASSQVIAETVAAFSPRTPGPDEQAKFAAEQHAPEIDAIAPQGLAALDEEALRAMVAEIVHDELAGELGERITRNVRKMVRREINRALTSRALTED